MSADREQEAMERLRARLLSGDWTSASPGEYERNARHVIEHLAARVVFHRDRADAERAGRERAEQERDDQRRWRLELQEDMQIEANERDKAEARVARLEQALTKIAGYESNHPYDAKAIARAALAGAETKEPE